MVLHDEAWSCLYVACMQTLMRWHWCHQHMHAQTHPTQSSHGSGQQPHWVPNAISPIWSCTGNDGMVLKIIGLERQRHCIRLNGDKEDGIFRHLLKDS